MSELQIWLDSTKEKREEILKYARSPIPTDPGQRQLDVSRALELGQENGDLLADIEKHLIDETARAILIVRTASAKLDRDKRPTADERRSEVKGMVSSISRLRDGLQVSYNSIKDRRFVLMNLNRS